MKSVPFACALSLAFAACSVAWAGSPPTFTGNVPADFGAAGVIKEALIIPDFSGVGDVGIPSNFPPGTISGWDLEDLRLFYDLHNDVMYVGINFAGIAGDADGDGDGGRTSAALAANNGIDFPNFGDSESFAVLFDTNRDGVGDVIAGVSALVDISGFTVASAIPGSFPPFGFGAPLPEHTGALFALANAGAPDIEFAIPGFSQLPGFPAEINRFDQPLMFNVMAFAGSLADDGFGEDNINNYLVTFGKVGFDSDPQGTIVTNQFLDAGFLVDSMSDCGTPGAFINDPTDNPTTDDIIATSGRQVLTTRCNPNDDTSDSGTINFNFIDPVDLHSPGQATFVSLSFLDIEDSGSSGRGTSHMTFFDRNHSEITDVPIPSGPNAGHFEATFSIEQGLVVLPPCSFAVARIGDVDDSGAVDTLCYNLQPVNLDFTIDIRGSGSAAHQGDVMDLPISIRNDSATRSDAIAVVTCGLGPRGTGVTLVSPRHIRLRPGFTNETHPQMLHLPIPQNLNPNWIGRPMRLRAKLIHPTSGVILAQDVYDFTVGQ
ncbi:MAG: hypothetical protein HYR85_22955 [Planctomycetes bacterium]|nr:hypothetical protein [Planctomycetota bacterium]MBI3843347.1 hypothetical protein [Planctomycetota bacterium]